MFPRLSMQDAAYGVLVHAEAACNGGCAFSVLHSSANCAHVVLRERGNGRQRRGDGPGLDEGESAMVSK